MLSLPTEATIAAMNVFTDRRHPFHTYNDHNRFRQFGFTQQNTVVNTDDRHGEGHDNLGLKGVIDPVTSLLQSVRHSDFHTLMAHTWGNFKAYKSLQAYTFFVSGWAWNVQSSTTATTASFLPTCLFCSNTVGLYMVVAHKTMTSRCPLSSRATNVLCTYRLNNNWSVNKLCNICSVVLKWK